MKDVCLHVRSFFIPQILDRVTSFFNGQITVEKYFGYNRIVVGGYIQSGKEIEHVMRKALYVNNEKFHHVNNILLFGVAG